MDLLQERERERVEINVIEFSNSNSIQLVTPRSLIEFVSRVMES